MHEPDRAPKARFIENRRVLAKSLANISLFGGLSLSIIGAILAIVSIRGNFFLLSLPGLLLAIITIKYADSIPDEGAHSKAALSIILNIVIFILLFILFIFFREATQTI